MEWIKADTLAAITLHVNGRRYRAAIEPRMLLSDFLRQECGLIGTHVGCEHGVCGACTVLVNGEAVRSCLMLAVSMTDAEITTIEGLARHPDFPAVYQARSEEHTSELQSPMYLVCRLLLEKKKKNNKNQHTTDTTS